MAQAGVDFLEEHKKKSMELVKSRLENLSLEDIKDFHNAIKTVSEILSKLQ